MLMYFCNKASSSDWTDTLFRPISGQLRQEHQYKKVKVELRGHTKTHIVKAGQTMNNICHVNQVPILMLIISYNSDQGNDTN